MPGQPADAFLVLAAHGDGAPPLGHLPLTPTRVERYPDGRPWIVARLTHDEFTVVRSGDLALALIGPGSVDRTRLHGALAACTDLDAAAGLARRLPGVFHLVVTDGRRVRVQGTASGLRRVFHAPVGAPGRGGAEPAAVAADRADLLARLASAPIDPAALALRLVEPLPHPLADRCVWRGVRAVAPGDFLLLDRDGAAATARWWRPPRSEVPLAEGTTRVRAALRASVDLHIGAAERIGCELSGGLDSTALAWLAQESRARSGRPAPILAVTAESRDPLNDDADWARRGVALSTGVEHRVLGAEEVPLVYADPERAAAVAVDEPSPVVSGAARVLALTGASLAGGSGVHLTGYGGDQLFTGLPTLSRDLLRRRPAEALRRLRAYRGMFDWPLGETLRQLVGRGSYRDWLRGALVPGAVLDWRRPLLDWGVPVSAAPWLTEHAVGLLRAEFAAAAARDAEPLAATRGRHLELDGIRAGAREVRALTEITAAAGLPLATPFLDDRVVEAALAVRIEDRSDPSRYKPLLRAAMRGVVPEPLLARTTKGEGSHDLFQGLRAHMGALARLWDDSRLAELGLVDAERLRGLCARPDAVELDDGALLTTFACEVWLRAAEPATGTTSEGDPHGRTTAELDLGHPH